MDVEKELVLWKICFLLSFVLCACLFAVYLLMNQNRTLEEQNCHLQQILQDNVEAARKKAERDRNELEKLHRDLKETLILAPDWYNTALPSPIAEWLQKHYNNSRSTIGTVKGTDH